VDLRWDAACLPLFETLLTDAERWPAERCLIEHGFDTERCVEATQASSPDWVGSDAQ